jgi:hypothetical protein
MCNEKPFDLIVGEKHSGYYFSFDDWIYFFVFGSTNDMFLFYSASLLLPYGFYDPFIL